MIQITVKQSQWMEYKKLTAEKNALDKSIKQLVEDMGIPTAEKLGTGEFEIVNGNKDIIGKVTVFEREAFKMPACTIRKIS